MPMRRSDDFCRDSVRSWRDARPRIDLYGAFRRETDVYWPADPLEPPRRGDRLRASTKSARVRLLHARPALARAAETLVARRSAVVLFRICTSHLNSFPALYNSDRNISDHTVSRI